MVKFASAKTKSTNLERNPKIFSLLNWTFPLITPEVYVVPEKSAIIVKPNNPNTVDCINIEVEFDSSVMDPKFPLILVPLL